MSVSESATQAEQVIPPVEIPAVPGLEGGTGDPVQPEPLPESEGETEPVRPSFDEHLDSDLEYKSEYETRLETARKDGDKEGWRKYQSATQPAIDDFRDVLTNAHQGLTALQTDLTRLVQNDELDPAKATAIVAQIGLVSTWEGFKAALTVLGQAVGDDSLAPVMWGRKYNEVKRQSIDPAHRDESWTNDLIGSLIEGAPEEVVEKAAKNNPALKALKSKWQAEAAEAATKTTRAALDASQKAAGRANGAGPDGVVGKSGSGISSMAEADRRYLLPVSHPDHLSHADYKSMKASFSQK